MKKKRRNMSCPISVNCDMNAFIKNELSKFVMEHTGQDALSAIDEIVLSYMVSVLESLGDAESPEEDFDVDEFAEMMSAYIPSFTDINSSHICEWMCQLAVWLKKSSEENARKKQSVEDTFVCLSRLVSPSASLEPLSSSPCGSAGSSRSRSASQSEDEEKSSIHIAINPQMNQEMELLVEMFPHIAIVEIQQCYNMSDYDCDKTVQLILQRQDCGQQLNNSLAASQGTKNVKKGCEVIQGDKQIREHILNRYGYIDQNDDTREHKPIAPKAEPKKLIRYRDNKIVSVKGERFSEVKTEDSEAVKKTSTVLKPARQYRFH